MTCFFIDTAKNIIDYLNVIYQVLKEGGVWINLGPLLWQFVLPTFLSSALTSADGSFLPSRSFENNSTKDPSIELSLDEVKTLCAEIGFVIKASSCYAVAFYLSLTCLALPSVLNRRRRQYPAPTLGREAC